MVIVNATDKKPDIYSGFFIKLLFLVLLQICSIYKFINQIKKIMKKLLFVLMMFVTISSLSFVGCKEEESCDCGYVTDYGYDGWDYWVEVRNECTNHYKYFSMDYYDWLNTWPGDYVCSSSGNSWKSIPAEDESKLPATSLKDKGKPDKPY